MLYFVPVEIGNSHYGSENLKITLLFPLNGSKRGIGDLKENKKFSNPQGLFFIYF